MDCRRILVIDPDRNVGPELLRIWVGAEISIRVCQNAQTVAKAQREFMPHALLVYIQKWNDVGHQILKELGSQQLIGRFAILAVLPEPSEILEIEALVSGADSVITLPLRPRALLHRLRALIRWCNPMAHSEGEIRLGPMHLNRLQHSATIGSQMVFLGTREFDLLYHLAKYPGKIFTRQELMHKLVGVESSQSPRTIDVHICNLRDKLPEGFIGTYKGIGYQLNLGALETFGQEAQAA
jgi:DNA-binding response OmpR family regulator